MKKIEDENSTTMTVRLSVAAKEAWKRLADRDNRSVGNYLEQLLARVEQRDSFDLADVMDQLEVIKTMLRAKAKTVTPRKDKWEALYNMSLDAADGGEIMTRESWKDWIDHLRKMKVYPIEEYPLKKHLELFEGYYNDMDFNIDYLVSDLIKRGAKSVYIHSELMNEFRQEGKRR
jgi:predicted transcriptional regulator